MPNVWLFSGCVRTPADSKTTADDDDDVAAERQRIYSDRDNTSGDILRMIDLVKVWKEKHRFFFEDECFIYIE